MSDFEVNKRLSMILGGFKLSEFSETSGNFHSETPKYRFEPVLNYCNSWLFIGPLIEVYNVTLLMVSDGAVAAASMHHCEVSSFDEMHDTYISADYYTDNKNPKRAAAICIIKLLENNDE